MKIFLLETEKLSCVIIAGNENEAREIISVNKGTLSYLGESAFSIKRGVVLSNQTVSA